MNCNLVTFDIFGGTAGLDVVAVDPDSVKQVFNSFWGPNGEPRAVIECGSKKHTVTVDAATAIKMLSSVRDKQGPDLVRK